MNDCLWLALLCAPMVIGCGIDPFADGPPAGNPEGPCAVPPEAQADDSSHPDQIVGNGTIESCTSDAFVNAIAAGGVITFECGPNPVTITLDRTATVLSGTGRRVVIDGGGRVALSGGGNVRILYMNSCDPTQGWSASDCRVADAPRLTVQNLTFIDGNARGLQPGGGGALFVDGAKLKVVNSRFFRNFSDDDQWDGGGGAIRVVDLPGLQTFYVVQSTFGGRAGLGNIGSNGGAISSKGTSFITILNSIMSDNSASPYIQSAGGAIYSLYVDALNVCGVKMTDNHADDGPGGAIWFGSHSDATGHTGVLSITSSTLRNNPSNSEKPSLPGIDAYGIIVVQSSTIK